MTTTRSNTRRRNWTDEERLEILRAYEDEPEGTTIEQYCKRIGINFTTFYDWRKKLGRPKRKRSPAKKSKRHEAKGFGASELVELLVALEDPSVRIRALLDEWGPDIEQLKASDHEYAHIAGELLEVFSRQVRLVLTEE